MSGVSVRHPRAAANPAATRRDSPGRRAMRRFLRHRLAVFGLAVIVLFVLGAILAPLIGTRIYGPIGRIVDVIAVVGTVFGVLGSGLFLWLLLRDPRGRAAALPSSYTTSRDTTQKFLPLSFASLPPLGPWGA